jgi:two-component system, NarL family, sensor kinase
MKAHKPRIDGSRRTRIPKWPGMGPGEACDKLYWMHAPEFLFGIRVSHSGQFVYEGINPAFECLLGISSEDIREKAVSDCMSDEDAKSICASCDACVAEGKLVRYQHRLVLGGCQRDFETIVVPVLGPESGSIVRLVGSHRVVKERAVGDAVERTAIRRAAENLGVRLLSLQEEVQQRIASDLHDSTCQHLIAASLNVMRLRHALNDIGSAGRLCDDIFSAHFIENQSRNRSRGRQIVLREAALCAESYPRGPYKRLPPCESDTSEDRNGSYEYAFQSSD